MQCDHSTKQLRQRWQHPLPLIRILQGYDDHTVLQAEYTREGDKMRKPENQVLK